MRRILIPFAERLHVVLIILFTLPSCEKNEERDNPLGWFMINGEKRFLLEGFVNKRTPSNDFYPWSVFLISKNVNYATNDVTGVGDALGFSIQAYNKNSTEFPEGAYLYSDSSGENPIDRLVSGYSYINYNFDTGKGKSVYYLDAGEVTISRVDELYIIYCNLTFETGEILEGYYKGPLTPRSW